MKTNNTNNVAAYVTLVTTFFIWGSLYVAAKLISGQMSPFLIAGLRCAVGLLPLLMMAKKHLPIKIEKSDWKYFVIIGILGHFLFNEMLQLGIKYTGATMSSLINALTPVSVTLFAAVILKEKITPIKYVCLMLALAGTVVITIGKNTQGELLGIASLLGSVAIWGIASVLIKRLGTKYPPIIVTFYSALIGLAFHLPVIVSTIVSNPPQFTITGVLVILYLGMIGSGVAQYTWAKSLASLPASTCSLFYPLQVLFSAILGVLLLKETFSPNFFIGLVLVSADVALNTWDTHRSTKKQM